MRMVCFGSSSSGNCYYVEMPRGNQQEPVKLLLEAGIPYKEVVRKAMNENPPVDLTAVNAVLVTHSHNDHACAVNELQKRGMKIYGNSIITHGDPYRTLQAGIAKVIAPDTVVTPIHVEHDAPDPLGFIIRTTEESILFVNDCKMFDARISIPLDYVMIEANYDGQTVHFAYENALQDGNKGEAKRYQRIVDAHMSIKHCIQHLKQMDLTQCKGIFLMHLSDRNSNAEKFKLRVQEETGIKHTFVCRKYGGIQ